MLKYSINVCMKQQCYVCVCVSEPTRVLVGVWGMLIAYSLKQFRLHAGKEPNVVDVLALCWRISI